MTIFIIDDGLGWVGKNMFQRPIVAIFAWLILEFVFKRSFVKRREVKKTGCEILCVYFFFACFHGTQYPIISSFPILPLRIYTLE